MLYHHDSDRGVYVWEREDEFTHDSYRILLTQQESISTNQNDRSLEITFDRGVLVESTEYNIQFSGVITRRDTGFIRRKLVSQAGIPLGVVLELLGLVCDIYDCFRDSVYARKKIEAHVHIEIFQRRVYERSDVVRALVSAAEALMRSFKVVEALEKVTIDCKETPCMVCLEELALGSEATKMPCSHVFHTPCIAKWLKNRNVCPLCRFKLPPSLFTINE